MAPALLPALPCFPVFPLCERALEHLGQSSQHLVISSYLILPNVPPVSVVMVSTAARYVAYSPFLLIKPAEALMYVSNVEQRSHFFTARGNAQKVLSILSYITEINHYHYALKYVC